MGVGREARPRFLQIVHCPLQLFQAFKSLGLAQDTGERTTSSSVIFPLLMTHLSWSQPAQPQESIHHHPHLSLVQPPTQGLENPALLLPSKVSLLSLICLYAFSIISLLIAA